MNKAKLFFKHPVYYQSFDLQNLHIHHDLTNEEISLDFKQTIELLPYISYENIKPCRTTKWDLKYVYYDEFGNGL